MSYSSKLSAMARRHVRASLFFLLLVSLTAFGVIVPVFAPLPSLHSSSHHLSRHHRDHSKFKKVPPFSFYCLRLYPIYVSTTLDFLFLVILVHIQVLECLLLKLTGSVSSRNVVFNVPSWVWYLISNSSGEVSIDCFWHVWNSWVYYYLFRRSQISLVLNLNRLYIADYVEEVKIQNIFLFWLVGYVLDLDNFQVFWALEAASVSKPFRILSWNLDRESVT